MQDTFHLLRSRCKIRKWSVDRSERERTCTDHFRPFLFSAILIFRPFYFRPYDFRSIDIRPFFDLAECFSVLRTRFVWNDMDSSNFYKLYVTDFSAFIRIYLIFETVFLYKSTILPYVWKIDHKNERRWRLVGHSFTKLSQNVCLVNTHILVYWNARCDCKLWNVF